MTDYPHMCCDGHPEIGHRDSENEMCPLCSMQAEYAYQEDACNAGCGWAAPWRDLMVKAEDELARAKELLKEALPWIDDEDALDTRIIAFLRGEVAPPE